MSDQGIYGTATDYMKFMWDRLRLTVPLPVALPPRDMTLYLVNPGVDLTLELYVASTMEEAVCIQWERIKDQAIRQTFVRKLEKQLERLIAECMDWDLKEPTPAQASYAALISRKLDVSIPSEAVKYRFHMALFIDTYQEQYRADMSKLSTPNTVEIEKVQALVAKKLKSSSSDDNKPADSLV